MLSGNLTPLVSGHTIPEQYYIANETTEKQKIFNFSIENKKDETFR